MTDQGPCMEPLMLLHLPDILLDMIIGYHSYNEIANLRIVCQKFNEVCKRLLNRGFRSVEHYHMKCQKEVKSQLPRRESERRDHPLAHHCNILSGIETRLSLLNMTFLKYVDAKLCCFIPGKVIDEIYRVLRFVQGTKKLFIEDDVSAEARNSILKELRANVILKELRDISSMAMEHFEEKILPAFKHPATSPLISFYSSSPPHFSHSIPSFVSLSPGISGTTNAVDSLNSSISSEQITHLGNLKLFSKQNKSLINTLKKQLQTTQSKLNEAWRKINEQDQIIVELSRVVSEQTSKVSDHETKFAEVNRKIAENDQKMNVILNLLNCNNNNFSTSSNTSVQSNICSKSLSSVTNVGASTSGIQRFPHLGQTFQSAAFFLTPSVVQPAIIPVNIGTTQQSCFSSGMQGYPSQQLVVPQQQQQQESSAAQCTEQPLLDKEGTISSSTSSFESSDVNLEPLTSKGRRKRRAPADSSERTTDHVAKKPR